MLNSRFGYSVKKNSFKGLNIDCIQYSNNILFVFIFGHNSEPEYYLYSDSAKYFARILFVFAHSEKTNIIRIRIRSKFWYRTLFVFVFGQNSDSKYYSYSYSVKILIPNIICIRIRSIKQYSLTSVCIMNLVLDFVKLAKHYWLWIVEPLLAGRKSKVGISMVMTFRYLLI